MGKNGRIPIRRPLQAFLAALLALTVAPAVVLARPTETERGPFRPSKESDFENLSDVWGIQSHELSGRSFIDADTEEVIAPESALPTRRGYTFGGYWSTPYEETGTAREYFDENLAMVGDPKWYELSAGARSLYPHWKYRVYLSTNAMDSTGNAVGLSDAGHFDLESVPAGTLRVDDNGTPENPYDDRTYIEAVDGSPLQLPRVTGRTGYLDAGLGTDGATPVNARAWGVRPGAYGWSTGIIPLDANGMTDGSPRSLALDTANIDTMRAYDGSAYFRNQNGSAAVFPAPDPTTHSITLYLNWENRAKTYDVKLTSAYDGFTVSNAPTRSIKAVYDAPLLMEKNGHAVAVADGAARFFAPEKIAGEGEDRAHEYFFNGFRTQPNGLDGMQGDELIGARIAREHEDARAHGMPVSAPFRLNAEAPELFAAWGRPRSTLTLDLNGGMLVGVLGKAPLVSQGGQAVAFEPGALTSELPGPYGRVPVRPGYTFKGYYTKATGAGAAFANFAEDGTNEAYYAAGTGRDANRVVPTGLPWDFSTHTTLYAHWEYAIDFRLDHETDCAGRFPAGSHASLTQMSGPIVQDASDRYGNRYPLEHAVVEAVESQLMATALAGAQAACEGKHLLVTALAGVPVKVPVAQGFGGQDDAWTWQVRHRDAPDGEVLATAKGVRSDGYFTSDLIDGVRRPVVPFAGLEPHPKTKTLTAFVDWSAHESV